MKQILSRLYEHERLSREEARQVLLNISHGEYNHIQVASFITIYQMRSVSIPELQGFRDALLELCVPVSLNGMEAIDIVGTGGDSKNTFNVSTLSAVVVAGAGYKVAKHGSYGVSSAVGSSNVLMALGYEFTNDQEQLRRQLDRSNICFLHAPLFHPALKEVVPVRKQLGVKTFFNMLGPLVNPAQPSHQLFGTYSQELARMYQYIMQETGRRYAIVYSLDGYDEVSLTGPFKLRTNERDVILAPEDLGKPLLTQGDLYGGETEEEAAAIFRNVLNNEGSPAQFDVVAANAGLAIHCLKPEQSLEDCIEEAQESLLSKQALQAFQNLIN
ncbi:MAG: anthranilate phosphoribosyltransferase [Lewinellaceae bacterium]|nr:anthranilate phosphoribosyltransferase [Phaeodactylibacter sp.]MCB9040773.1 anthranilate phosphoribosyltransferase [Lewinellaceae bacterium]